jgi:signal transduction histidine kinase
MAMHARGHRKQIILFLVAVVLPSLVLIVFTLRVISQDRELAQKRIIDERRRMAREFGRRLLVRIEEIKIEEAGPGADRTEFSGTRAYRNREVVLIGLVDGNRLVLPWEANQEAERFHRLLMQSDFAQEIRRAEKEEFDKRDFPQAVAVYRQAMKTGRGSAQASYARLSLARALAKADREKEALEHYRTILARPPGVRDEYGVPLALYAAGPMLDAGAGFELVGDCIRAELEAERWLSPAGSYLLRDLVEKLIETAPEGSIRNAAENHRDTVQDYIRTMERAVSLRRDFQRLGLIPIQGNQGDKNEPRWVAYGEDPWLVSLAPPLAGSQPLLFVVEARGILASLKSEEGFSEAFAGEIHLVTDLGSEGESLGPNFSGLRIGFGETQDVALSKQWKHQPVFYSLTLLLVLSVTVFGAYLVWRDVRRDLRMAKMRSQFVSSVSHELKTPLTAIRMFAETLRLGRSKDEKTRIEYLDTIVSESQRLTRLLDNVLDFSKIEEGKRSYRLESASLYDIIQASARAIEYPLSQYGFRLNVSAEKNLPHVRADRDALEQAILNLLHNAMKYSGESRDIELRLQGNNGRAMIQVVDHGVGIDPKERRKIFEKFYRIPTRENQRTAGTGLGLALVLTIVNAHGGHIEVESVPGKGSIFSIYLPLEGAK